MANETSLWSKLRLWQFTFAQTLVTMVYVHHVKTSTMPPAHIPNARERAVHLVLSVQKNVSLDIDMANVLCHALTPVIGFLVS